MRNPLREFPARYPARIPWQLIVFASVEPRGALFGTGSEPLLPLASAWLMLGLYVVLGLVSGAACAWLALGRGLPPIRWFFAGLLLNVFAIGFLLTRRARETPRPGGRVPGGVANIPTPRAPPSSPTCGAANHPAARACSACGAGLDPWVEAETDRA